MQIRSRHLFPLLVVLVAAGLSIRFAAASGPAAMVKDIQGETYTKHAESRISRIFSTGNVAYYFDLDAHNGMELWRSDGTPAGTTMIKDINPGTAFSRQEESRSTNNRRPLPFFTQIGATIFFVADDGSHGNELWKTDGTPEGTMLVKDIWPGTDSATPYYLTAVGGRLFFLADDGIHGGELWTSDGTEAGTRFVKDLWPGPFGDGYALTNVNGTLFLFAFSNTTSTNERMVLWKSDGTEAGTVRVRSFNTYCSPLPFMVSSQNLAYFAACTDTSYRDQLWRSDGTAEGTFPITAIPYSASESRTDLTEFVPFKNGLYFSAGGQLWRTTGLTETTTPIASVPARQITPSDDQLFFAGSSSATGTELWVSDGVSNTRQLKDIYPGSISSNPNRLIAAPGGIRCQRWCPRAGAVGQRWHRARNHACQGYQSGSAVRNLRLVVFVQRQLLSRTDPMAYLGSACQRATYL